MRKENGSEETGLIVSPSPPGIEIGTPFEEAFKKIKNDPRFLSLGDTAEWVEAADCVTLFRSTPPLSVCRSRQREYELWEKTNHEQALQDFQELLYEIK